VPSFEKVNQTQTDDQGHFTLVGVSPGRYRVFAIAKTWSSDLIKAVESYGEEVIVEEGEHLTKELKVIPSEMIDEALKTIE